jgi:hypothetical protein
MRPLGVFRDDSGGAGPSDPGGQQDTIFYIVGLQRESERDRERGRGEGESSGVE